MYDSWYVSRMGQFVDEVETALAFRLFKPVGDMDILDVGCGTGNFTIKLAKMGCKVTGIDISDGMLNIAEEKAKELKLDAKFHIMDVYKLEFPDSSFDAVFSMAALEFIKEPKKAYSEMIRVLKPGGSLLIGTIQKDSPWGEAYLDQAKSPDSIFRFADFKSLEELVNLDNENLISKGECLFVPPGADERDYCFEGELKYSKVNRGGFVAALWKKPV
jgi:ubiquinone/menaquinone biosynthesis C-methylase UbiE